MLTKDAFAFSLTLQKVEESKARLFSAEVETVVRFSYLFVEWNARWRWAADHESLPPSQALL